MVMQAPIISTLPAAKAGIIDPNSMFTISSFLFSFFATNDAISISMPTTFCDSSTNENGSVIADVPNLNTPSLPV